MGCSLLFPVLVFQHCISRADEALVVGVALENERHKGRGIFVERPGDAAQEQEAVEWVVEGVGVVASGSAEDLSLARGVGPEGVAAGFGARESVGEGGVLCVSGGSECADDFDVVACE